jgi:hypothetical protein
MTARLVTSGFMLLTLVGCGWSRGQDSPPGPAALRAASQLPPAKEAAKSVSRSLWAVVPAAPKRKQDVRPELIKGSAVAVADDTLLISCQVLGKRKQVGLVRHNKYRVARLASADPQREVCVLRVPDGPLHVVAGYRDPADLRLGEPIYALMNWTSADVALAQGELTKLVAQEGEPRLETSVVLPAGVQSGVLIDGHGNLVGLAAPRPGTVGGVTAAVLTGRLAPQLASVEAPSPTVPLLVAAPRAMPVAATSSPLVLILRLDDDESSDRQSVAARPAPQPPAAASGEPADQEETDTSSQSGGPAGADRGGNGDRSGHGAGASVASAGTGNTSTDTSGISADSSDTSIDRSGGTASAGADPGSSATGNGGTGSARTDTASASSGGGAAPGTGDMGSLAGFDLDAAADRLAEARASVTQRSEIARSPAVARSTSLGTTSTSGPSTSSASSSTLDAAADRLAEARASVTQRSEIARSPAVARSTSLGMTAVGRPSTSFVSSSASSPGTSADDADDGNGKGNSGRGGRGNSGKGGGNGGKGGSKGSGKGGGGGKGR